MKTKPNKSVCDICGKGCVNTLFVKYGGKWLEGCQNCVQTSLTDSAVEILTKKAHDEAKRKIFNNSGLP
jgi:hypothetical protein